MLTTSQFRVFTVTPEERTLSRARHLVREGQLREAEAAYLGVIRERPDLQQAWAECFQLLRDQERFADALALAEQARAHFGPTALTLALMGAALVELGRYREGLAALEEATEADPNLGLVWHEAGYAAYRLGEPSRALLALDRAFALEPHASTLFLRGRVLREAGRYVAAEVAFGGAAEAAEFSEQRREAEREIARARRYAKFEGQRPDRLPPARRWFADTGAVVLTTESGGPPPTDESLLEGFVALAASEGWSFTEVVPTDEWAGWRSLAARLELPLADVARSSAEAVPLVVGTVPHPAAERWERSLLAIEESGRGLSFVLHQRADLPPADVAGVLGAAVGARADLESAIASTRHPESRLQHRRLG
jgi:tetratricopeptide (TPR) repeat protein